MERTKLINFRLPFALALALACGTGFAFALAYFNVDYFYMLTAVPFAAVIFILFAIKSKRTRTVVYCALMIAILAFGAAYSAVNLYNYQHSPEVSSAVTRINGRVESVEKTQSGTVCFVLSDVSVNGKKLNGKTLAYLDEDGGGYADVGYVISALCSIEKYDLFSYGQFNYNAVDGIRYRCLMYGTLQSEYGFSLFGSVRSAISKLLNGNLSYETASVARAMLTGDTSTMDALTLSSFRYGGLAHIFAVSGLHIGIVFSVLSWFLKKVKANKFLSAVIIIAVIFFYAGVCGFTPSSIRAAVMCTIATLSKLLYQKYDLLNSLSLAVIFLLIINPFNLLDVGFILSVSAMLGIVFLAPNLKKLFGFMPKKLTDSFSTCISAQAATFPGQMLTFGYVSAAGMVLNLFVLPIMSVLYALLFSATALALIIPPVAYVLPYVCIPLEGFIGFFVSLGFENALLSGLSGWWTAVLPAIFLAALSDKFNLKIIVRAVVCSICAISFALAAIFNGAVYGDCARIIVGAYYGGGMTLIRTSSGNTLVVTQGVNESRITSFINKCGVGGVEDIVILGDDEVLGYYIRSGLDFENVYLSAQLINISGGLNLHYESAFSLKGVDYEFIGPDALKVGVSGVNCVIYGGQSQIEQQADLYICPERQRDNGAVSVCYGELGGDYNVYLQGSLHFVADNGTISVEGLLPSMR